MRTRRQCAWLLLTMHTVTHTGLCLLCVCADVLVRHLQTLVDLGFKLTTGSAEALRPSGAQLLQQLLRFFGDVPDPDVPELLLLEQYQVCVCVNRHGSAEGKSHSMAVACHQQHLTWRAESCSCLPCLICIQNLHGGESAKDLACLFRMSLPPCCCRPSLWQRCGRR